MAEHHTPKIGGSRSHLPSNEDSPVAATAGSLTIHFDDGTIKSVPFVKTKNLSQILTTLCVARGIEVENVKIKDKNTGEKLKWDQNTVLEDLPGHEIKVEPKKGSFFKKQFSTKNVVENSSDSDKEIADRRRKKSTAADDKDKEKDRQRRKSPSAKSDDAGETTETPVSKKKKDTLEITDKSEAGHQRKKSLVAYLSPTSDSGGSSELSPSTKERVKSHSRKASEDPLASPDKIVTIYFGEAGFKKFPNDPTKKYQKY